MELDSRQYLERLSKQAEKGPATKEQALAEEIHAHFGGQLSYPFLLKMMREKGYRAVYMIFSEVRHAQCHSPARLFKWKLLKEKVIRIDTP